MTEPCDFQWLREQLDNHVNEPDDVPLDFLLATDDDDSDECQRCGCEWCEDDLDPATGLCVRCAAEDEIDWGWECEPFRPPVWARGLK